VGHVNIHQDQIRLQLSRQSDGFSTRLGFSYHLHQIRPGIHQADQSLAEQAMIIGDQDAHW
jgi:hypothetical protein